MNIKLKKLLPEVSGILATMFVATDVVRKEYQKLVKKFVTFSLVGGMLQCHPTVI